MKVQADMLRNISKQLEVVQLGIELILDRLAEIEEQIRGVPGEVTKALTSAEVRGMVRSVYELLGAYADEVTRLSVPDAQRNMVPRLVELGGPYRVKRNMLLNLDELICVPIAAAALQAEVHLMIASNQELEVKQRMLNEYATYFRARLDPTSPRALPAMLEAARQAYRPTYEAATTWSVANSCRYSEHIDVVPGHHVDGGGEKGGESNVPGYQIVDTQIKHTAFTYAPQIALTEPQRAAVARLLDSNVIQAEELPQNLVQVPEHGVTTMIALHSAPGVWNSSVPALIPSDEKNVYAGLISVKCSERDTTGEVPSTIDLRARLLAQSTAVLAYVSLSDTARQALDGIEKFLTDLERAGASK